MKIITEYQCEICHMKYRTEKQARHCEARGVPNYSHYPIGCIDGKHILGNIYDNMCFAIFKVYDDVDWGTPHDHHISAWGTRDTGYGDNIGASAPTCGGESFYIKGNPADINFNLPVTKRMIEKLKEMNITPTIWDGEKGISIEEYKKKFNKG